MKTSLLIVLLGFSFFGARAQFSFGVKAGVNYNGIRESTSSPTIPIDNSVRYHVGLYGNIQLTKKLSLSPEFQYIKKQAYGTDFNVNYLEIPVLLDYQISNLITVQFGPTIGEQISVRRNSKGNKVIHLSHAKDDLDFGLAGGIKFNVNRNISILTRYNYSFLPFEELYFNSGPSLTSPIEHYKVFNSNVQLSVMYRIK